MLYNTDILTDKLENYVKNIVFDLSPNSLFEPISYTLSLGGKRIRPLLTLMSANLFKDIIDDAIKPAIGIEIFHNFTLLHDDLMDDSDVRRGKAAVHKKWNANTAILSGDAMLIESYKYISSVTPAHLPQTIELFSNTAMDVCRGQQYDMDFEERPDVTELEYLDMIRLKTAVLLACSLKIGAILADAPSEDADHLYDFGINIGLAFQIKDDLLDVYGDSVTFGKNIGDDIVNNKKTFLLIKALELADASQKRNLLGLIFETKFTNQEKIEAVKNIYNELNLKEISEEVINNYYLSALNALNKVKVEDSRKKQLASLAQNLMYREK